MEEILLNQVGKKIILLGNEAIVRGALESGVQFVSTYPGTPASEIGNTFSKIASKAGVYFEFSTNEKVAMEVAAGASFSNLRSLVAMKSFGLNVASDFLIPLVYSGVRGGMVIITADDPNCWSSAQSEEDSRVFAYLAHIPTLEPSTPQECKDFTKLAFELSEKYKIPVMIRETTRVALQSGVVKLGEFKKNEEKGEFIKNPHQFSTMPPRVLEMHQELLEKIEKLREFSEKSSINKIQNGNAKAQNSKIGIIASGISYLYAKEVMKELNLSFPVLKLGFFYPLPEKKIAEFIRNLKKLLIIEELDPYLEKEIKILAKETNPQLQIFGKSSHQYIGGGDKNILPEVGELRPEYVMEALTKLSGKKWKIREEKLPAFPKRLPQFCPNCPYWLVFGAIKRAVKPEKVIFGGEIGCYMMAALPPHNLQDYLYCMGSSVGVAHGITKSTGQKVISFVGDSSFFHAGIPALINAVYNKSNPLIIVMDNSTTAMTGHQPHPGVGKTGMGEETVSLKIEDIVRACGVKNLKIIDQQNQEEFIKAVKEFLEKDEVSVIIARFPCVFVNKK